MIIYIVEKNTNLFFTIVNYLKRLEGNSKCLRTLYGRSS